MDMDKLVRVIRLHSRLTDDEIIAAGEHGADSGWSGFTYTSDTVRFYDKNQELIWELLADTADNMGESINGLVGSFRTKFDSLDSFKNLLAWFALEEAGRWLAEE